MKDSAFFADQLSPAVIMTIKCISASQTENFNDLAALCGLNPKTDFRFSNLSGVDFSGCDLLKFDFTGSDLRGCFGSNVTFDATTILQNATTENSIFSYSIIEEKYFKRNPDMEKRYNRINSDHWANTITWIMDNAKRRNNSDEFMYIARKIMLCNKDATVRTNAIMFMWRVFGSSEVHRDFILNLLAKHGKNRSVRLASLKVLADMYGGNRVVYNILKSELCGHDGEIRKVALNGVLKSGHFLKNVSEIAEVIAGEKNSGLRRSFVGRVAALRGDNHVFAVKERHSNAFVDFVEPITRSKLDELARNYAFFANDFGLMLSNTLSQRERQSRSGGYTKIDGAEKEVLSCLNDLIGDGVPFVIDKEILDLTAS